MKTLSFKLFPRTVALLLPITPLALHSEPADDLIVKGDSCYAKFQAEEALKYYLPAEKLEPNNVRLLVRISREYRHLMSDARQPQEKLSLGNSALEYARRAAALEPNDAEAELAVAISYGKLEPFEGNREKIESSRVIKSAVDRAIKLEPGSDLAWHVLGRWHAALAEVNGFERAMAQVVYGKVLPDSTYQEAAQCFEKAIELNPNRLMHYIELGRVYARMGKTDEARNLINKGLVMRDTEKDDPETKRQGRKLLAQMQ
ncbi:MAG: tetratricopeptide repeat protein [Verrucomicrobia bacterium]|nr:tetratricopeptide repeat protein [Verrucomicrobiota bacterium]